MKEWQHTFPALSELYFKAGRLLLTGEPESLQDPGLPNLGRFNQAYFYLHTAAALNHKYARFEVAILTENGLIPNQEAVNYAMLHSFGFLKQLDPSSLLFKKMQSVKHFETVSQSHSLQ